MLAIGLNAFHGDSSCVIVRDGKLICGVEEERLRRIKHWAGIPSQSIQYCLKSIEASLEDIDYIVLSKNPFAHFIEKIYFAVKNNLSNTFTRIDANRRLLSLKDSFGGELSIKHQSKSKLIFVEHHKAHIASTYYSSPFKDSLILSCDGAGDMRTTMWAVARNNRIEVKGSIGFPHSLGFLYTAFTQFLGFLEYGDEYKAMGLAPYGKPNYKNELYKIVKVRQDSKFILDLSYFNINEESSSMSWNNCMPKIGRLYSDKFVKHFGKPRLSDESINNHHTDIASSLQNVIEEIILSLLKKLNSKFKQENLCLSGGVFANSVICGKLSDLKIFKQIHIPYAPGDAGTAVGALAYFYYKKTGKRMENMNSPYIGTEYNSQEIKEAIKNAGLRYEEFAQDQLLDITIEALIDKKIVGWFQGKMEFGYRALGNRSILAHPGYSEMKDILNNRIKNRESFRPFAPSVMEEHAAEFFYANNKSPYMSFVAKAREDKIDKIKAVVHVDNTARIHTVSKKENPLFHRLLERFYRRTGLPLLLNTSFNENEPIVNSPSDAIDCFLRTKMDILVMGNFVIRK